MSGIPSFELGKTTVSTEAYEQAIADATKTRGFSPGNYTVLIQDVQYHANRETGAVTCKSDPTWVNVSMRLVSADGRDKKHYIQVPFKDIYFMSAKGKKIMFPYLKLVEFMAGIGERLTGTNYGKTLTRYFANEGALSNLEGNELSIDIGFTGPYVKRVEDNKFAIVIEGREYVEGESVLYFPDADSAVIHAAENLNTNLQRWPEIIKIHAAPARELKEVKKAEGWD